MNKLIEISGAMRGAAILSAVKQIVSEERRPTPAEIDSMCRHLKGWEPTGDDEVSAAMELLDEQAEAHAASLPGNDAETNAAPNAENAPTAAVGEEMNTPAMDPAEALEALRLAHVALANARAAVIGATNRRNAARARLSDEVQSWQVGMPRVSKEQALRDVVRTGQIVKANGGGRHSGRPGPSRIDMERFYQGKGDGNDFLRKQMRRGAKRFGRGDVMTAKGIMKLPSEQ